MSANKCDDSKQFIFTVSSTITSPIKPSERDLYDRSPSQSPIEDAAVKIFNACRKRKKSGEDMLLEKALNASHEALDAFKRRKNQTVQASLLK